MRIVIETPRLLLREMTEADLDFVAAMLGDAEVMRHYPRPLDRDEAARWMQRQQQRYAEDGHGLWLAVDRQGGEPVGQVGLVMQTVDGVRESEVGYLLHRPFWSRGLATEAARATRDHAFGTLDRSRVISLIRPVNGPSRRVAARVGMRPERRVVWRGLEHEVFALARGALETGAGGAG